jgi:ATP/maltotriose-dependent transcriptional regulator MalT
MTASRIRATRDHRKHSQPPVVSAEEIVRLRLLDRLTGPSPNASTARITLVRGPAGFGKTTLLAQAYRQVIARAESAVWLDCSELTSDAQYFIDSLYAAADLTGIDKSEVEFTPSDLAARLAEIDPAIYVFLDEFERLVGTPVEAAVERLTLSLPGTAHVIISSRLAPHSWFLKRELNGLATTIEALDLRFNGDELRALLKERVNADDVERIEQLTEGWPMAVQLARLRSRDVGATRELLSALQQGAHGLFEYLAERVVKSLSDEQQRFLRDTSILSFVNPLAANAVMQRDDSYALLASVIHLQPIVTVTGDAVLTLRLHPLFRQYMRDQLARSGQQRERELHRRAAGFYAATGRTPEGVQQALESGDPALAVSLIDRAGGEELVFTVGPPKVHLILESIPPAARELSLRLRLMELTMAAVDGRTVYAEQLAARFEAAVEAKRADPESGPAVPSPHWPVFALGLTRVLRDFLQDLHRGCSDGTLAHTLELDWYCRRHFATEQAYLGFVLAMEILLLARYGRLEDMRRCLDDYHALCERNGFAPNLPSINPQRGLLAFLSGEYDEARRYLERTADLRPDHFAEPELLMVQLSKALIAAMLHERGRLEDALAVLDGLRTDLDAGFAEILALDVRTRILCTEQVRGPEAADRLLAEALQQARQRDAWRLVLYLKAVRLQLLHGRRMAAAAVAQDLGDVHELLRRELERPEPSWLFLDQCARAVVPWLVDMLSDEAEAIAVRLYEVAEGQGRRTLQAVALVLVALARRPRDEAAAVESLRLALSLTAGTGVVQVYAELGAPLAPLMIAALGERPTPSLADHVRSVLRRLDRTIAAEPSGWKTLSERERDIVLVLAAHASTKAVARALGLAPETVKHHLKRIYGKLGVHTREEALARVARSGG